MTGASLMTTHRDLDELARQGLVRKFHGGVSAQPSSVFEASAAYRVNIQLPEKQALATAAVQRIEQGMSVLLDTSTTNLHVAEQILTSDQRPLTVITNYLSIMHMLRNEREIQLIGIGGDFYPTYDAFYGRHADDAVESISANIAFLSTSAMTTETTYQQNTEVVSNKRAMIQAADHRILMMDPTKIRRRALHRLAPLREFTELLLTEPNDAEFVEQARDHVTVDIIAVEDAATD